MSARGRQEDAALRLTCLERWTQRIGRGPTNVGPVLVGLCRTYGLVRVLDHIDLIGQAPVGGVESLRQLKRSLARDA